MKYFSHPTLKQGDDCPECALCKTQGKLGYDTPQSVVKLVGGPLITGTKYVTECLRCRVCQKRYKTSLPEAIKNEPKYSVSASSSLAIAHYTLGTPLHRIENSQAMHKIPVPDATQSDLLSNLAQTTFPVYDALIEKASNSQLMVYDDTVGRILENQAQGKTTHTTAFVSVHEDKKIGLFLTGENHAGKNVSQILEKRTNKMPFLAMMDASPSNIPKTMNQNLTAKFILCYCLTHGRRKFYDIFSAFQEECQLVLDIIGTVYAHDAHCKKNQFTPEKRLKYHQEKSQPLMDNLWIWLNNQWTFDLTEKNANLGQAIRYLLRHWKPLTTFLREPGALLDSSWAERTIKIAIRYRRNALFYKTTYGARVGDCLMSLIHTAKLNHINPFDYLNHLQRYGPQVALNPSQWLPWNYQQTVALFSQNKVA